MTEAEWREAFRRCAIIADWSNTLTRPTGVGEDGMDWCAESEKFDVEANALAILDDEEVLRWNEAEQSSWIMKELLRKREDD